MNDAEREKNMKFMAAALACPHDWSKPKKATIVGDKGERRDGDLSTCSRCGCHRATFADGRASLFSADALGTAPPAG